MIFTSLLIDRLYVNAKTNNAHERLVSSLNLFQAVNQDHDHSFAEYH